MDIISEYVMMFIFDEVKIWPLIIPPAMIHHQRVGRWDILTGVNTEGHSEGIKEWI